MLSLRQWLYYIIYSWWRLLFILGVYTRPVHHKSYIEENSEYINPIKTRFLSTFESESSFDENIDPLFYNKAEYTQHMMEAKNELEIQWRKRIIMENTPRGNIIMYYDPYKMAFAFYCNQKVVSYEVLNAVAMKYVVYFRCRSFFLDEYIVPGKNLSPFIKIHFAEDVKTKQSADVKKTFAKLRNYTKENVNSKKLGDKQSLFSSLVPFLNKPEAPVEKVKPETETEKKQNTFVYLGKTDNFQILQCLPKPKRVLAKFTSPLLESLNTHVQRDNLSYRSFRKLKESIQTPFLEGEEEGTSKVDE